MNTLVIYESMYGNTRRLAEVIAEELPNARAVPVWEVTGADLGSVEHIVLGGPTHAFGMSRPSTRAQAELAARRKPSLTYEAPAGADGLREWLSGVDLSGKRVTAFDTRVRAPMPHAARRIERAAVRAGGVRLAPPQSFVVEKGNSLRGGELERAREWARSLPSVRSGQDVGP